jgi:integrase/recombinase XerD
MTALRQRMIRELELHRKSAKTIQAYVTAVAQLAQYYGRAPDQISLEQIRDWLHELITGRKLAFSSVNQKLAGLRFFYRHVLGREDFQLRVPAKRSGRLPEPLSRGEITRLLEAAGNLKHRVLLMTCYGGGLRVSFATHLMEADTKLPVLQRLLGHTSLATTAKYLHVTSQHLQSVRSPLDLLRLPQEQDVKE